MAAVVNSSRMKIGRCFERKRGIGYIVCLGLQRKKGYLFCVVSLFSVYHLCLLEQAKEVHIVLNAGFFAVLVKYTIDLYSVVVTKGCEILVGTVEVICAEGDATVGITIILVVAENAF